jgi:hypothetical protein
MKNEKGKEKKKIEFNPSDYDYMDKLPLLGWVWEFARRSSTQQNYWTEYQQLHKEFSEGRMSYLTLGDFIEKNGPIGIYHLDSLNPSWKWDNQNNNSFTWACGLSTVYPLEVVNLAFKEPLRIHNRVEAAFNPEKNEIVLSYQDEKTTDEHPLTIVQRNLMKENIMMALIDISAPMSVDDMLKLLKPHLVQWRKAVGVHVRGAKTPKKNQHQLLQKARIWKSYLIVYDLVQQCLLDNDEKVKGASCYKEVSNTLSKFEESYSEEKTIENHYKAAEKMINGGYKKYL